MATQTQERDTLEQLQSSKQVALLDAIDKLRSKVSLHDISFPQLIVCGDQSSGKSSVLEGLTRLSFPTKEGTCTTFATEVALRKEAVVEISCSIRPGRNRSPAQIRELSKFKRSFSALKDFSFTALVEEAQEQMRFGASSNGTKFFDDVLTVRYVGPDVPSLTIVDLPGLIQAGIGEDHSQSVEQVHGLVDRYMQDEKSIILAVVSARNDLNNQAVFRKVETVDPKGHRSLGIITKPDLLDVGSETEAKFLKLAQNEVMPLELGWHVVKNRGFGESDLDAAGRDRNEREFFAKSAWKSLLPSDVGIDALRSKLSEVLLRHICKELPTITASIREAITATETRISKLGEPRESQEAQRLYLTKNSERFQKLTDNALGGIYNDRFFALSSVHGHGAARLRTEIQNLNIAFAYVMYRKGHAWNIKDDPNVIDVGSNPFVSNATQQYEAEFDDPEQVTRADFLQNKIGNYVRESRPSGLPSLVNPWVIGEIFRDQSEPWADIAKYHLERVFQAVKEYTHIALESLMDSRTYNMILLEQVDPELESRKKAVEEKLEELLTPYREQDPTTYDPSFVFELNAIRAKRYKSAEASGPFAIGQMRSSSHGNSKPLLLTETIDDYTNSEIMDLMQVYYRVSTAKNIHRQMCLG
jgi:GTPase SAR1 family protein